MTFVELLCPRSGVSSSVTHILASKQRSDLYSLTNVPFRIDKSFVKVSFHDFYTQFPEWKKIIIVWQLQHNNIDLPPTLLFPLFFSSFALFFLFFPFSFLSLYSFSSHLPSLYDRLFYLFQKAEKSEKEKIEYKYIKS